MILGLECIVNTSHSPRYLAMLACIGLVSTMVVRGKRSPLVKVLQYAPEEKSRLSGNDNIMERLAQTSPKPPLYHFTTAEDFFLKKGMLRNS